jgi:hypothetical protein
MASTWQTDFLALFDRCVAQHRSGDESWENYFTADDVAFLRSIGCKPRELFDYVEDHVNYGQPDPGTILDIAGVRRDYLLEIQGGQISSHEIKPSELPAKTDALGGLPWLPRLIAKAEGKLRGELDPDIMYGCPGDQAFFEQHGLDAVEFLRFVWDSNGDRDAIVEHVVSAAS